MMKLSSMQGLKEEVNATLKCVVLEVGEVQGSGQGKRSKFAVVLADETGSASATCYDENKRPKFMPGMGIILMNAIVRPSFIAITSRTEVGISKKFEIPQEVKNEAPKLHGSEECGPIANMLATPTKTIVTVKGKVISVSPSTTKNVAENQVDFQEIVLKDTSAQTTVAIWQEMVHTIKKGEVVKLSKCRVRLFNNDKRLSTTRQSQCEHISHDDELDNISEDEMADDPATGNIRNAVITAVFDADPYLACYKASCNNTKLVTVLQEPEKYMMNCKTCGVTMTASAASHYLRVTVLLEFDDEEHSTQKVAMFKPQVQQIFEACNYEWEENSYDKNTIMSNFLDIIPVNIKCTIVNNTIRTLSCKRK